MTRITLFLLTTSLLVLATGCTSSPASRNAQLLAEMDFSTMISFEEALEIGRQEVPDGIPVGVELELEDDDENEPPAWEVVFFVPNINQVMEVEIDVVTGEVLEVEIEDDADDD